ncbi:sensor histidine kinase [Chryseobacterium sp. SN22]|uniref:sensor histidine kinase n=1 Tax=Chryseobacterium sp. SN22 TaxID=2606431 RepID=UPI0011ECD503|nr:sensor histidine kinase [Chryseobacterium sp. SN22]KAA0126804.1 sensor histidine kinase [Chryseobacterium sp. SN22]
MENQLDEIQKLIDQRKVIEEKLSNITGAISFSVDAGIINRLGNELVGRAETAVSELVKNSYDADANKVTLRYINTDVEGGSLEIEDDGNGMTRQQLVNGFMRLSSPDKINYPISPVYKRTRAGKKGIGRFATHRLGKYLTIITKNKDSNKALKLTINWSKYEISENLTDIFNPIEELDNIFSKGSGTKLIIEGLREAWSETQIRRVYRYVAELLQPDFISDRSKNLNIAQKGSDDSFTVECLKQDRQEVISIANLDKMVFDNSLGVIEGYILDGQGICEVKSTRFDIDDSIIIDGDYSSLDEIHFKAYYFIYNFDWYKGYVPKMEYNRIYSFGQDNGGIRLYRNGFRVLPYGERGNDWLSIEKGSAKGEDQAHVPFSNSNFFGFVEIVNSNNLTFEETSSREGLIENQAFNQLTDFIYKALRQAAQRINSERLAEKKKKSNSSGSSDSTSNQTNNNYGKSAKQKLEDLKTGDNDDIIDDVIQEIEELEMMRVLAGIGLNIAEFTHEIRQFIPSFNGSLSFLATQDLIPEAKESITNLKENFNRFQSYTSYIDSTFTQNSSREKSPQLLPKVIEDFEKIIQYDRKGLNLIIEKEFFGYNLYSRSMHPSEWTSVLYNFYTNSKKAIKRTKSEFGKIKIIGGREKGMVYIEFMDNGDGIAEENIEKIFNPFFTTSTPASPDSDLNEIATGTGLGLKIVKDIAESYLGNALVIPAESGYKTCLRFEVPEITEEEKDKYEL